MSETLFGNGNPTGSSLRASANSVESDRGPTPTANQGPPVAHAPTPHATAPFERPRASLVDEGTDLRGAVVSRCPLEVRGRVDGEVDAPALTVAPGGAVTGKVRVGELRVEGEIGGEVLAESSLVSGAVRDGTVLRARRLEVKTVATGKSAAQFGNCTVEAGDLEARLSLLERAGQAGGEGAR